MTTANANLDLSVFFNRAERRLRHSNRWIAIIAVFSILLPVCIGGDLNLRVQLVWGTDGTPPKDTNYTQLEPQIKGKLSRIFKWKNYFLIHEQRVVIGTQGDDKRLKLSTKCEIEMKRVDEATLQIKLFGEGRWTKTIRQSIKALERGELAVLAGDDKNNYADAWFVVISAPQN